MPIVHRPSAISKALLRRRRKGQGFIHALDIRQTGSPAQSTSHHLQPRHYLSMNARQRIVVDLVRSGSVDADSKRRMDGLKVDEC